MTYRALTLRSGTPLMRNGPVTRRVPSLRCLRRTTRFPRKRPARMMRIEPGTRDARGRAGWMVLRACEIASQRRRNEGDARAWVLQASTYVLGHFCVLCRIPTLSSLALVWHCPVLPLELYTLHEHLSLNFTGLVELTFLVVGAGLTADMMTQVPLRWKRKGMCEVLSMVGGCGFGKLLSRPRSKRKVRQPSNLAVRANGG